MDGKTIVTRLVALLIAFSLVSMLFGVLFLGGRGMFGNIVGLILNAVLGYFMIAGQSWARWVTVVRCGFSAIFAVPAFLHLPTFGGSYLSIGGLWLLLSIIISLAVAIFLTISKRVNDHFSPSSGL